MDKEKTDGKGNAGSGDAVFTTHALRRILMYNGTLLLGENVVEKLMERTLEGEPDLQWLYDCAMEPGNSRGIFEGDPVRLRFTNAGTCSVGIVCDVVFSNCRIPQSVLAKAANGEDVWPEDLNNVEPSKVEISYDEYHDEEGDDEEGDDE